jgi:hypothetical protein
MARNKLNRVADNAFDTPENYGVMLNKLKAAQGMPGTGIPGIYAGMQKRDFDQRQAAKVAEFEQYGRMLGPIERLTMGLPNPNTPEGVQDILTNVMGSTWGGGIAGTVLDDPINAVRNVLNPQRSSGYVPLTTYHGSPHRINNVDEANPMGRFDLSKIGTGEGAQAYGHGIYLAENPDVAGTYRDIGRRQKQSKIGLWDSDIDLYRQGDTEGFRGKVAENLATREKWIEKIDGMPKSPALAAKYAEQVSQRDSLKGILNSMDAGDMAQVENLAGMGHFYTVDLPDEHIARMLDWDKPLSEQPEGVRNAAKKALSGFDSNDIGYALADRFGSLDIADEMIADIDNWTGSQVRDVLKYLDGDEAASAALREAGIPGIKYFDGSSRAAGEGTRNFVIFDPEIAKILKRE